MADYSEMGSALNPFFLMMATTSSSVMPSAFTVRILSALVVSTFHSQIPPALSKSACTFDTQLLQLRFVLN